jgi:hypothetical protein
LKADEAMGTNENTSLLARSSMENVLAALDVLQRRELAVRQLRELLSRHHDDALEMTELQRIIESNTWLFGPRFENLGAEDDRFTRIAKSLRDKAFPPLDPDGDDRPQKIVQSSGRLPEHLFLARTFPTFDSLGRHIYRCIVIEVRRPDRSLTKKDLRQLEDYADLIHGVSEFESADVYFELILIGGELCPRDTLIRSRLNSMIARGEMGLVADDPRMRLYIMGWYSLLDSFELTNSFMLDKLKLKRLGAAWQSQGQRQTGMRETT